MIGHINNSRNFLRAVASLGDCWWFVCLHDERRERERPSSELAYAAPRMSRLSVCCVQRHPFVPGQLLWVRFLLVVFR